MQLPKGGLVYETLRWYGYPAWRLEEDGVSLCKVFWSLVLGIPFILIGRMLNRWGKWVVAGYEDIERAGEFGFDLILKSLTLPIFLFLLTGAISLLLFGSGFGIWWLWPLMLWLMLAAIVAGIWVSEQSKVRKPMQEVGAVLGGGLHAVKNHVCPIIRFESPDKPI